MTGERLESHYHISSAPGLCSVTTLIVGRKAAALIDPPFLIPDAENVAAWIRQTAFVPLKAIFITHHHPDHYFSANPILQAFPSATLYAAPYVCIGIEREYDEKVKYWPTVVGKENVPAAPTKPTPFRHSLFVLDGNEGSPVVLLGPLQGDSVDHTLFWLPAESTIICGDAIYSRSSHVWVEEIETPAILSAWRKTLDLIEALQPTKLVPGHIEPGWSLDAKADIAHNRAYLNLFESKIQKAEAKPQVDDLYETFKEAFPQAKENLDFFLGHLSNQFGEGGTVWEENRHHALAKKDGRELQAYWFTA